MLSYILNKLHINKYDGNYNENIYQICINISLFRLIFTDSIQLHAQSTKTKIANNKMFANYLFTLIREKKHCVQI